MSFGLLLEIEIGFNMFNWFVFAGLNLLLLLVGVYCLYLSLVANCLCFVWLVKLC